VIERGHLEEGGNDVKALAKQALGIFARETGGHFNSESLVPLEVGIFVSISVLDAHKNPLAVQYNTYRTFDLNLPPPNWGSLS
jgi:hypothetical protein